MSRLVIYGAGGFGREVVNAARADLRDIVLMDARAMEPFDGIPVLAPDELREDDEVVVAIGDGATRRRVAGTWHRFATVLAPLSTIGRKVELGEGAIICDYASITANVRIGRHFHMNGYSFVAHDCVIGDFVTFAGAVQCNGNVHIGDGVSIGSGAIIRNGRPDKPLIIGEGAVIGLGTVVVRSVPPYTTMFGNPAKAMPRLIHAEAQVPRSGS
jgi:sugar O-acyltransferase (sialic acid O-acetyltransferase NeuD family)